MQPLIFQQELEDIAVIRLELALAFAKNQLTPFYRRLQFSPEMSLKKGKQVLMGKSFKVGDVLVLCERLPDVVWNSPGRMEHMKPSWKHQTIDMYWLHPLFQWLRT